jgi:3-deoxy-D-arabino-heptulosonate 7-phosphate (DAHP) synthase
MPEVFRDIVRQRAAGHRSVIGAMLERHLVARVQKYLIRNLISFLVRALQIHASMGRLRKS